MPTPSPGNRALAELVSVLGGAMARDVVSVFLDTFPAMLQDLSQGDPERCRRAAHSLKSSARQMGAISLSDRMATLEKRLRHSGETVKPEDVDAAAAQFEAIAPFLRAFAKSGK